MKNTWDYAVAGQKTSVKIRNAPGISTKFLHIFLGGNSQFSLGWGNEDPVPYRPPAPQNAVNNSASKFGGLGQND